MISGLENLTSSERRKPLTVLCLVKRRLRGGLIPDCKNLAEEEISDTSWLFREAEKSIRRFRGWNLKHGKFRRDSEGN